MVSLLRGAKAWDYPQLGGHLSEDIEQLKGLFIKMGSMMDVKEFCEMADKTGDKTNWETLIRPSN